MQPVVTGSYRNHCPVCLWSMHLDDLPGDRASPCHGPMRPVGLQHRARKGWQIVHRCERCGRVSRTRAAVDDPVQPDAAHAIAQLSGLPT